MIADTFRSPVGRLQVRHTSAAQANSSCARRMPPEVPFDSCHCRKLNPASKHSRIGRCSWLMRDVCNLIWLALIGLFRSQASLQAEILTLRHQLNVLRRKSPQRPIFSSIDRLVFACVYRKPYPS
jgi:hypothetical protein